MAPKTELLPATARVDPALAVFALPDYFGLDGPAPTICPDRHLEQRNDQSDHAHDHQDHPRRLDVDSSHGRGHGPGEDSAYGN